MALPSGSRLGPYEILGLLGAGGMGEVYRALDPRLGREVAIKTIHEKRGGDEEARWRFTRETRAVAALSHPNIVAIHDVGLEGGVLFAVTELLEGETLRGRLERGPLPWPEAVAIATAIADGLAAAHARGIVHRDLKPANVFLTADGRVKVLDFGLATTAFPSAYATADSPTLSRATLPGTLVGTVAYMSPEQARGRAADARSDVFALGCLAHEMLSGTAAFDRESVAEILAAVLKEEPAPLPQGLPPALVRVVLRCLEKDPSQRFLSAKEVAAELRAVEGSGASAAEEEEPLPVDSLAVLPFADLSPGRDQEYFCEGLADELINALTRLRGLRVASRTSSFQFKGASLDVREIGERLGVRAVLEGSVRRAGDRLRVTVQVTDVAQGFTLTSERYDRTAADVLEVQDDIAQRVVQALEVHLSESEKRALETSVAADPRAYDLYLRGRGLFHQIRFETLFDAREAFLEAITVDPSFALAHAALADTCSWLYQWRGREPAHLAEALSASARALDLRPDLAEVHAARGQALALSGDLAAAEREFRAAIDLNPRLFDPHYAYARACLEQGRFADAVRLFERATGLRPEDYQAPALLALAHDGLGELEKVQEWNQKAVAVGLRHVERHPEDVRALYIVGTALIRLGETARGLEWVERALALDPEDGGTLYNVACAYAQAGRTDLALDTLERALDRALTNLAWIVHDPDWRSLRDHPRFQGLLARLR
jgi:serine/threonine protein kinase/Flp pilus assembly protein TadD